MRILIVHVDVKGGGELDVVHEIAAQDRVHQPRHELVVLKNLLEAPSFQEGYYGPTSMLRQAPTSFAPGS
jgi:hypothetical protein